MELFVALEELNETLLKKAVTFIRERLESAEEGAMEVELIDITEAEWDDADCEEVSTLNLLHHVQTPQRLQQTTEAMETTVEAPVGAVLSKPRGVTPPQMKLRIQVKKSCFTTHINKMGNGQKKQQTKPRQGL